MCSQQIRRKYMKNFGICGDSDFPLYFEATVRYFIQMYMILSWQIQHSVHNFGVVTQYLELFNESQYSTTYAEDINIPLSYVRYNQSFSPFFDSMFHYLCFIENASECLVNVILCRFYCLYTLKTTNLVLLQWTSAAYCQMWQRVFNRHNMLSCEVS